MALSSTSSTRTRASNLTGLIDIDALVEAQTLRQKKRINTQTQDLKIQQYKQLMYQEIQGKAHKMYQKYCDILSSANGLYGVDTSAYKAVKFSSTNSNVVTATTDSTAKAVNYKVEVNQLAKTAKCTIQSDELGSSIKINGHEYTLTGADVKEKIKDLNSQLSEAGVEITASYSDFVNGGDGGVIIQSKETGASQNFTVDGYVTEPGTDSQYTITDMNTNQSVTKTSSKNEAKLDGVTFKFSDTTTDSGAVTLNGKIDASDLTDKIVDFINDYNELLGNINTKLYEKYDKSYRPLTDDDKEGLTDSQITKLEEKAKVGLLQNDDTLTEFANALKEVMTTISSGGQSIERLGFKAVNDYKAQNGLFTVPSDTSAIAENIANNIDQVKELFAGDNGIFKKLGDVFKKYSSGASGVTPQSSVLGELAGITNGSYNDITTMGKDIKERKNKIAELQAALTEKENNLYTKYSTLESNLSKLQSQQSSLSSYFA